jgi:hypothetical protein
MNKIDIDEILHGCEMLERMVRNMNSRLTQKDLYAEMRTMVACANSLAMHIKILKEGIDAQRNENTAQPGGGTRTT